MEREIIELAFGSLWGALMSRAEDGCLCSKRE
jgi:hypothetical protein